MEKICNKIEEFINPRNTPPIDPVILDIVLPDIRERILWLIEPFPFYCIIATKSRASEFIMLVVRLANQAGRWRPSFILFSLSWLQTEQFREHPRSLWAGIRDAQELSGPTLPFACGQLIVAAVRKVQRIGLSHDCRQGLILFISKVNSGWWGKNHKYSAL